jgi:hypothetical protein
MKYQLKEDHKVRNTNIILKAGIYTLEQLQEAHKQDSLEFCIKYTKLGSKLFPLLDEEIAPIKAKKGKNNV